MVSSTSAKKGGPRLALAGMDFSQSSTEDLVSLVRTKLDEGIHGLCFSPYIEGQGPGTSLETEQIRERMQIIAPSTRWIRSFSCTDGNELIPKVAKELGRKTLVGAWIGSDLEMNEKELAGAIKVANEGYADILAIGNEVMLREEMTDIQLAEYIQRVGQAVPAHVEVGYVDAYYLFELHPVVADACDVLLTNCYPFWEGCALDYATLYMKDMYRRAQKAAKGKKVIVSETGWPNKGTAFWGAEPSYENAMKYFLNTYQWAEEEGIEIFYFSSFDENWKIETEGDVGSYWGLWDTDGRLKY